MSLKVSVFWSFVALALMTPLYQAVAQSCASVTAGAQLGPSPNWRNPPPGEVCYVDWPGGTAQRDRYEQQCRALKDAEFVDFFGDYGSKRNTCIFRIARTSDAPRTEDVTRVTPTRLADPLALVREAGRPIMHTALAALKSRDLTTAAASFEKLSSIVASRLGNQGQAAELTKNDPELFNFVSMPACFASTMSDRKRILAGRSETYLDPNCINYGLTSPLGDLIAENERLQRTEVSQKENTKLPAQASAAASAPRKAPPSTQSGDPMGCFKIEATPSSGQWFYRTNNTCQFAVAYVLNLCDADRTKRGAPRTCSNTEPEQIGQQTASMSSYTDAEPQLVRVCNLGSLECYNPPLVPR